MTQDEARRFLRLIRFSATKGRSLTMAWVAARCGYSREHFHRVAMYGRVSERLTESLGRAFQSVINGQNQITLSSLAEYDGGPDPRGGPRPARRPDDGRLRSARLLRSRSRRNASSGLDGGADDHGGADVPPLVEAAATPDAAHAQLAARMTGGCVRPGQVATRRGLMRLGGRTVRGPRTPTRATTMVEAPYKLGRAALVARANTRHRLLGHWTLLNTFWSKAQPIKLQSASMSVDC